MQLSYRARLKHDLLQWQERGFIRPDQAERIASDAFAARGIDYLQAALVLSFVLLMAPAIIAFVAANWDLISPITRMLVLFLGNGLVIAAAYLATLRQARNPSGGARFLADGLATLSLVLAASSITLIAQTFHLPGDMLGFARTVAGLGLVTALVTRSGGAALLACAALIVGDAGTRDLTQFGLDQAREPWPAFWIIAPGLFLASLSGWLPARRMTLLLLLLALASHFGRAAGWLSLSPSPAWVFTIVALALALGRILAGAWNESAAPAWAGRFRDGGEALAEAAAGLCLIGLLVATFELRRSGVASLGVVTMLAPLAVGLAAFAILRGRLTGRGAWPLADLIVLGAAALSLLICLVTELTLRESALLSVWGGIVPALALAVAGQIDERRALFGWALALCAALTIYLLFESNSLIALSGNLAICAILVALTLTVSRWLAHRAVGRSA